MVAESAFLEMDRIQTNGDDITRMKNAWAIKSGAVDLGAVGRSQIGKDVNPTSPCLVHIGDLGVATTEIGIVQSDVTFRQSTDHYGLRSK